MHRVDGHLDEPGLLLAEGLAVLVVAELAEDVDVGDADAGVDARAAGLGEGLAAGLDIAGDGAGQGADGGALDLLARWPATAAKSSGEELG